MTFKAKLRKIGNSLGIIIPMNVITNYKKGDEIELNVITGPIKESVPIKMIFNQRKPYKWCNKHDVSTLTCLCK